MIRRNGPVIKSVESLLITVSQSQHKDSNSPSIRSPVVHNKGMRTGLVLCVSFSAMIRDVNIKFVPNPDIECDNPVKIRISDFIRAA